MALKFAVNPAKAVEALAYVGSVCPGLSQKYVAKVFFFAEKEHLNRYGRPIIADTYIAMQQGPVPSTIRDLITQNWEWLEKPENFDDLVRIENDRGLLKVRSNSDGPFNRLSETDKQCLSSAVDYCKGKSSDELSVITHLEKAYMVAEFNRAMDYEQFIDDDNIHKDEILEMAREAAHTAVM